MRAARLVVCGIPLRVHPTFFLMAALAVFLGMGSVALVTGISLLLHESCHVLAARRLRLRVTELELMPFGGAARVDALWSLRPAQILVVSLAGPACNLLIALLAAAVGWWRLADGALVNRVIRANLALMAFNLLPALPMDGGRVLTGLLGARMPPERAVRVGLALGWALAGIMVLCALYPLLEGGAMNVTLLLCAVYIVACSERERASVRGAAIRSMVDRRAELFEEGALPLREVAVSAAGSALDATRAMRPRYLHRFAIYDEDMRHMGYVEEAALLAALMKDPSARMERVLTSTRPGRAGQPSEGFPA